MIRFLALLLWSCVASAAPLSVVFDDAPVLDLLKVLYGEISKEPFVLTPEALQNKKTVSVNVRGRDKAEVVRLVENLLKEASLTVERRAGVVWVDVQKNADDEILVYRPKYRSTKYLADIVQSLTSAKSLLNRGIAEPMAVNQPVQAQNVQNPQKPLMAVESPTSALAKIDRSEVDQLAFSVPVKDVAKVRKLLADVDTPTGEILLKAAIFEVGSEKGEGGAISLVGKALDGKIEVKAGSTIQGGMVLAIGGGGMAAVISALDADSRFKSVTRPQVRVRNGSTARFTVGSDVPVLGNALLDKNGNPVQSVDYKSSGVILSASPEIRENSIEINLSQEISNFVQTATGVNNSPTLNKRALQTRLTLQPGEVVVIGGLDDDGSESTRERLPFFGWLTGKSDKSRKSEILLFLEAQRI